MRRKERKILRMGKPIAKITQEEVLRATIGYMKVCPFCGGHPVAEPWHGGSPRKIIIQCDNEDCDVLPDVTGESPEDALERWNKRVEVV